MRAVQADGQREFGQEERGMNRKVLKMVLKSTYCLMGVVGRLLNAEVGVARLL